MNPKSKRKLNRLTHLLSAGFIGIYIYSPWSSSVQFSLIIKAVIIPLTAFSGLLLWKGPLIKKWLNRLMKFSLILIELTVIHHRACAQDTQPLTKQKVWGLEFSPVGLGLFNITQGKLTYQITSKRMLKTEVGLGFLYQAEFERATNDAYNKDGAYSAMMASAACRLYFWKDFHFEEVINFGQGKINQSKVDGNDYRAFVIFTQSFIGYKFNIIRKSRFDLYAIGQAGIGYVPFNSNQWPRVNASNSSVYPLGDLKLGINF